MFRLPTILLLEFGLLALTLACGGGGGSSTVTNVSVSVTPASATVTEGKTLQLAASVAGSSNTAVQWVVSGVKGGTINLGSIGTTGLYTAANAIPAFSQVTISAIPQADPTKSASATITVVPAGAYTNASLKGTYVFQLFQPNGPYAYFAGEVTADGNGNLSNGIADMADTTTGQPQFQQGVTGSYSIASDGRGSVTLGAHKFEVALASTNGGQMVSFDANGAVVGMIQVLDTSADGTPFPGPYVFELEGGAVAPGWVGSTHIGSINFNSDLTISGTGLEGTYNGDPGQTAAIGTSISGTYEMPDQHTGRGTLTITVTPAKNSYYPPVTFDLVFYRQNVSQLILIGADTVQYQGYPPANELHSGFAFLQTTPLSSFPPDMTFMDWGVGTIGNSGGISGDDRATLDNSGNVTESSQGGPPIPGTYTTSSQGLILDLPEGPNVQLLTYVMTASSQQGVFLYPAGQNAGDGYRSSNAGVTAAQAPGPYQNSSFRGNYTFEACIFPTSPTDSYLMAVGQFQSDGQGNLKGLWDVNGATLDPGFAPFTLTAVNVSGTYTVNSDGSGQVDLSSDPLPGGLTYSPIYFVIQNQDQIGASCGVILKQQ